MKFHLLKQAGVTILLVSLILILESKSALGAYHAQLDHVTGVQMAAMSLVCAMVAFVSFGLAGAFKDDERPHVRARAKAARVIALAFLIVPVGFLGSSIKMDNQARHWAAYIASPAYAADQAFVADRSTDVYARQEAQARLIEPTSPDLSVLDGELYVALFLQLLLIFASDALRVPAPITQEERLAIMYKERGRKAAATRRRNKFAKKEPMKALRGGKS